MNKSTTIATLGGITAIVLVIAPFVGIAAFASTANEQVQTCTVEDKDRSTDTDGESIYQVYTDCGVLRVEDNLFKGVFNSADLYSEIDVDETYDFTTVGWRIPFLSAFPTIIAVD